MAWRSGLNCVTLCLDSENGEAFYDLIGNPSEVVALP